APAAQGPYTIEASALYQPLSPRFAAELFVYRTKEVLAFERYYQAADRRPELLASASTQVN
ncbi:MAG TPA: hypothetical protein DEA08_13210, partial [Planctomycetes bacterium]|nr:hypothetical protein [Planctomycetota bacterium]